MKWFWNHCRRREEVSLLAADILRGDEKIATQRHLAQCVECRAYYNDLREIAAPLAGWERDLSSIEATQAMQTGWAKAVQQATTTSSRVSRSSSSGAGFLWRVWREIIAPSRYAWSGLAALWVAMLVVNRQLGEPARQTSSSSPQAILQAWKERSAVFAEWERAAGPAAAAHLPRPRSEKEQDWILI